MIFRVLMTLACCLLVYSSLSLPAQAARRAFVAGIDEYANVPPLKTAVEDARAIAKQLEGLGFTVTTLTNATQAQFDDAWSTFLGLLAANDDVVFYFGGHGVQIDGANYLLPRNLPALAEGRGALISRSIDFTQVVEAIQTRQPRVAIYILDACRNDPFAGKGRARDKGGAATPGLARIERIYNAFVMYSAAANAVALDRPAAGGTNSIYVHNLLPLMAGAELSLVDVAKRVQVAVAGETGGVQRPDYFDGVLGQYFLAGGGGLPSAVGAADSITNDNVIRLGGFATWDGNCQSRPAPRISVSEAPRHGSIVLRYESFTTGGTHFGNACAKSKQRGIGVYYVVGEQNRESTAVDRVKFAVNHWSVAPVTSVDESFEIDLATRYSRRTSQRP